MYAFRKTETFIEKNIKSDPCSSCFKNVWKYWFLTNWIKVLFHSQSDNCVPKIRFKSNETSLNWMDVCVVPGRHLTVFNSQSLLQVGGRWSEYKQTLDMPFQVKNKYLVVYKHAHPQAKKGGQGVNPYINVIIWQKVV